MAAFRAVACLLAVSALWLGLSSAPAALADELDVEAAGAPLAPGSRVVGVLSGSSGGSFASYAFVYPGDGARVTVSLDVFPFDPACARGVGVNVYGPTNGKLYASAASTSVPTTLAASFASTEPGRYLVQVYNYTPQVVSFSLAASREGGVRTIAVDPGHGGPEIGAVSASGDLLEKDLNLKIALKLAALLRDDGHRVVLTRDEDRAVSPLYRGGSYAGGLAHDLQTRVDAANAAGADLFLSIHNNGGPASESGTEVWYNESRPFSEQSLTLAKLVQDSLLRQVRGLGYPVRDRGIKSDATFRIYRGRSYNLYVLGPGTGPRSHTPTQMPGVLGESLFVSNPGDAAMLRQERTLDAIARGYRDAIAAYFRLNPGGQVSLERAQ